MNDPLQIEIAISAFAIMAMIAALGWWLRKHYRATHDKLDSNHASTDAKLNKIYGAVESVNLRNANSDGRMEHSHSKLDKLRRGFALLFHGDEPASKQFANWWRSWYDK